MAPGAHSIAVEIPDKLYFRIGEVDRLTGVKAHTLRYWETEFGRLKPQKSGSGQRRYTRSDIELVLRLKDLLWRRKFTIAGARTALAKGEEKDETPYDLPVVSQDLIAQEAALIEKASAFEIREIAQRTRETAATERERNLERREQMIRQREQNLEARLREAQEALAARQADNERALDAALAEQLHELDMLRTRAQLLDRRADEAVAELEEVRVRESRMTRAMAQVRRGIIELRHRLHEAGQDGS